MIKIAIDGPSGAGKSFLAKAIAQRLGIIHVDTGALYRAVGLYMYRSGISKTESNSIISALKDIKISLTFENGSQYVVLNGENVNNYIREPQISMYASTVSALPEVRAFLLETQRSIANNNSVVMDGRDIGTVILPDADVKIYLTANDESRARRRFEELSEKGVKTTLEDVLSDMSARDKKDSTRAAAPAIPALDAVFLDNSCLDRDETLLAALKIIEDKTK